MEKSGMVERNGIKDRKKGISLKYSRSGPHTLLRCRIGVCKALFLWQVHWGHGDLSCEAGWSHYWAIIVQKSVLQEHSISHGKILHGCSLVDWINLTCQFLQLGSLPVTGLWLQIEPALSGIKQRKFCTDASELKKSSFLPQQTNLAQEAVLKGKASLWLVVMPFVLQCTIPPCRSKFCWLLRRLSALQRRYKKFSKTSTGEWSDNA